MHLFIYNPYSIVNERSIVSTDAERSAPEEAIALTAGPTAKLISAAAGEGVTDPWWS